MTAELAAAAALEERAASDINTSEEKQVVLQQEIEDLQAGRTPSAAEEELAYVKQRLKEKRLYKEFFDPAQKRVWQLRQQI